MTPKETLRDILVSDLPHEFVNALIERLTYVYKESTAKANNDPAWGESGARYIRGHYRHVLSNELLMKLASEHGLSAAMKKTETDSADFLVVSAGRLSLTISHVKGKKIVPDRARHREQYSKINSHLPQTDMFESSYIDNNADIYAIICHGESGKGDLGFVGFSFINEQANRVLDHVPVQDVADLQFIQTKAVDERDEMLAEVQKAEPMLKKPQEKKEAS